MAKAVTRKKKRGFLRTIPAKVRPELRAAVRACAVLINSSQKTFVPVDSGDLRDSIGFEMASEKTGKSKFFNATSGGGDPDLTATIFAGDKKAYYARWVEFGTQAHSLAKGADISRSKRQHIGDKHPGSSAQPFFYRGIKASMPAVKKLMKSAIRKASQKAASES